MPSARATAAIACLVAAACGTEQAPRPPGDAAPAAERRAPEARAGIPVAVTIDDLPWVGALSRGETRIQATERLLRALADQDAIATGFVNCGRVQRGAPVLRLWLGAGMQLGNHTSEHMDLNRAPLAAWLEDVRSCDTMLRGITGEPFLFFRYPYLHEGRTAESWAAGRRLLEELGSPPAHVTLHTADWVLAAAYGRALRAGDASTAARIGDEFVEHVVRVLHHYEGVARERVGRGIAHVLLLHANALVADHLPALLERLRAEGVHFVPLAQALEDPVYALPNDYIGPQGLSWLYRLDPAEPGRAAWDDEEMARLRGAFPR